MNVQVAIPASSVARKSGDSSIKRALFDEALLVSVRHLQLSLPGSPDYLIATSRSAPGSLGMAAQAAAGLSGMSGPVLMGMSGGMAGASDDAMGTGWGGGAYASLAERHCLEYGYEPEAWMAEATGVSDLVAAAVRVSQRHGLTERGATPAFGGEAARDAGRSDAGQAAGT